MLSLRVFEVITSAAHIYKSEFMLVDHVVRSGE